MTINPTELHMSAEMTVIKRDPKADDQTVMAFATDDDEVYLVAKAMVMGEWKTVTSLTMRVDKERGVVSTSLRAYLPMNVYPPEGDWHDEKDHVEIEQPGSLLLMQSYFAAPKEH